MRAEAIFLNGVYEAVIEDILRIQKPLPEQILYLQPHSGSRIVHLDENPPRIEDSVRLFLSTTTDLSTVQYVAEIVGWDDKRKLSEEKGHALNRIIWTLQSTEPGLYDFSGTDSPSLNLLHVRRMQQLSEPFGVDMLVKTSDAEAVSAGRTTAGGWTYVENTFD